MAHASGQSSTDTGEAARITSIPERAPGALQPTQPACCMCPKPLGLLGSRLYSAGMDYDPFAKPFTLRQSGESFIVESANGRLLAYVYFEDEPGRRGVTRRLTREDARRMAAQIQRLPETLAKLRKLRAGRDDPA